MEMAGTKKGLWDARWEVGDVPPVTLPDATYGECGRASCKNIGELGNGVCQVCWDRGVSRAGKKHLDLPNTIIS